MRQYRSCSVGWPVWFLALALSACATSTYQHGAFRGATVLSIPRGASKLDVFGKLGNPPATRFDPDGAEVWTYISVTSKAQVGVFTSQAAVELKTKIAEVRFLWDEVASTRILPQIQDNVSGTSAAIFQELQNVSAATAAVQNRPPPSAPSFSIDIPSEWDRGWNMSGFVQAGFSPRDGPHDAFREWCGISYAELASERSPAEVIDESIQSSRSYLESFEEIERQELAIDGKPCVRVVSNYTFQGIAVRWVAYVVTSGRDKFGVNFYCAPTHWELYRETFDEIARSLQFGARADRARIAEDSRSAGPAETTASSADADTVYVTATGTHYHRAGCRHLVESRIANARVEARERYEPCSICRP